MHSDTSGPGLIGDILCFAQARRGGNCHMQGRCLAAVTLTCVLKRTVPSFLLSPGCFRISKPPLLETSGTRVAATASAAL